MCTLILRAALVAALSAPVGAGAHDFWLQPAAFWTEGEASLTLQVGDGASRQRSRMPLHRIVRFASVAPDAVLSDRRAALELGGPTHDAQLQFESAGAHVVALETDDRARSYLSASAFEEYAREEGLTLALEERSRARRTGQGAAEKYRRCAKAIIQVGAPAASAGAITPLGLSLEIVPEIDPYAQPRPDVLPVRVLYEGRTLAGALVKLIDLKDKMNRVEAHVTDAGGRARFSAPPGGSWLLSVVWTKPLEHDDDVDFATTFSTLSFGVASQAAPSQTGRMQPAMQLRAYKL